MGLILKLTIITVGFIIFTIYTNKFYNPYKLYLLMGKKGVGKSTILQKIAWEHYKKKWNIYTNIGDTSFKKAKQIDCSRLWEQDIKPHSVILIDEVNLLWDNRDFKKFPQELNQWFRLQRHKKIKIYMFSQTSDVDKKIRDLTDRIYLVKRYFQVLIIAYPYEKEISPPDHKRLNNPNEFVDTFQKKSFLLFGTIICWLPKWIKTHDSFKDVERGKGENNVCPPSSPSPPGRGNYITATRTNDTVHSTLNNVKSEVKKMAKDINKNDDLYSSKTRKNH